MSLLESLEVMVKIPNLRGNVLARSNIQEVHALASPCIQALLGGLVYDLPLLGVGPLLLPSLPVTHRHLHLLPPLWEGCGHSRTVNLCSQLIIA